MLQSNAAAAFFLKRACCSIFVREFTDLRSNLMSSTHSAGKPPMTVQQKQSQEFVRAMFAERAAWFAINNRFPGMPGHDAALWAKWVSSVQLLITISEQQAAETANV